jgi:hypothetical protein
VIIQSPKSPAKNRCARDRGMNANLGGVSEIRQTTGNQYGASCVERLRKRSRGGFATGRIALTGITIHSVRLHKLHFRLLALVVALVQLTGPAAASLADAQLEAAGNSPNAASHVEAHGRPECARVHTDDCALCQYLATAFNRPAPAAPAAPPSLAAIRPPVAGLLGYAPAALGALQYSRGPPNLV